MSRTGIKRGWSKERLPRIGKIPAGKLGLLGMAVKFKVLHRDRSMVLETEGLDCIIRHARNKEEFEAAIAHEDFDVILSDFALPNYNGLAALAEVLRHLENGFSLGFAHVPARYGTSLATGAALGPRGATAVEELSGQWRR